jgi:hypothetical protein
VIQFLQEHLFRLMLLVTGVVAPVVWEMVQ